MAIPHGVSFASVQAKLATYVIRHCTRVIETQKKKKKDIKAHYLYRNLRSSISKEKNQSKSKASFF